MFKPGGVWSPSVLLSCGCRAPVPQAAYDVLMDVIADGPTWGCADHGERTVISVARVTGVRPKHPVDVAGLAWQAPWERAGGA